MKAIWLRQTMLRQIVGAKWTYQKERSFANNYFIFWRVCSSLITSYRELIWCINEPHAHIRTFYKLWSFIWRCFFPVSILKIRFQKQKKGVFLLFIITNIVLEKLKCYISTTIFFRSFSTYVNLRKIIKEMLIKTLKEMRKELV